MALRLMVDMDDMVAGTLHHVLGTAEYHIPTATYDDMDGHAVQGQG